MKADILDVTLRDGLQDEPVVVPAEQKLDIARGLLRSGVAGIEATAFVSPAWVPQLADAETVMAGLGRLAEEHQAVFVTALVPNRRGYERAKAAGCRVITVVMSATEAHNRSNLNMSRRESLQHVREIVDDAHHSGIRVRGSLSTAFGCPFEGPADVGSVIRAVDDYVATGIDELSLADTVGLGTPNVVRAIVAEIAPLELAVWLHFHDRLHQALDNVRVGLNLGVFRFEAALAGLGGCPFAPDAPGNVNAVALAQFLRSEGVDCAVDVAALEHLEDEIAHVLTHAPSAPDRRGAPSSTAR